MSIKKPASISPEYTVYVAVVFVALLMVGFSAQSNVVNYPTGCPVGYVPSVQPDLLSRTGNTVACDPSITGMAVTLVKATTTSTKPLKTIIRTIASRTPSPTPTSTPIPTDYWNGCWVEAEYCLKTHTAQECACLEQPGPTACHRMMPHYVYQGSVAVYQSCEPELIPDCQTCSPTTVEQDCTDLDERTWDLCVSGKCVYSPIR